MRATRLLLAPMLCAPALAAGAPALSLSVHDAAGTPVTALVDGNTVRLRAVLEQPARRATEVVFRLDGEQAVAACTVPRAARGCTTGGVRTLGWSADGQGGLQPGHTLAAATAQGAHATLALRLRPRPVVLVHGLMSDHRTWAAYTVPGGYLAQAGLQGFAVGDGRAEGRMDTGDPSAPWSATRTLPENAAALQRYIAGVRRATGAEWVDLVAHSMGGLVARYYVARLMRGRDVAQLVMLGSPHGGSECSSLAAALGALEPAALELRPAFVRRIFNRGVTRRQGVPFHMLAGDPIAEAFRSPCSGVPTDSVVSVDSASAIPGRVTRLPVLHTDMTRSQQVFTDFVLPLLRQGPAAAAQPAEGEGEAAAPDEAEAVAQHTPVASGRVEAGASVEVEVRLDDVAVAGFALFDPSRALEVTVRGASGRVIALTPQEHGLMRVEDPSSLLALGYGFNRPRPGPWRITLHAPRQATEFALSARVAGGAVLQADASPLTPARGEPVTLSARLEHPAHALAEVEMQALVRRPDGKTETLALQGEGAQRSVRWQPALRGLHGIDIVATARAGELRIERAAFLAVEVQACSNC